MTRRLIDARRCRFAGLVAALAVLAGGAAEAQSPRAVPLTETVHGVMLQDEYRWMEDPANTPEMLRFVQAENARFRALVDARPERAWFDNRLKEVSSSLDRVGGGVFCGDTLVLARAGASDTVPRLWLRDAAGKERLLLDPAKVAGNPAASFGAWDISPDCKRISAQVSVAGAETGRTHIFDIATGAELGKPIERIWGEFATAFLPGDRLLYTQMAETPVAGDPMQGMTAYIAPLGQTGAPVAVLGNGLTVQARNFPLIIASPGERFAVGMAGGARADQEYFVTPMAALLAGTPRWTQVATLADKSDYALTRGDALFLNSTLSNGAGTVTRYRLSADGARTGAGEVVFAGTPERLIKGIAATRDGIFVHTTTDGAAKLWLLPDGRGPAREIALPFEGTILGMAPDADMRGLGFALSGWTTGTTIFRVVNGRLVETGIASQVWPGAKDMAVTRLEAVSKDGTKVPLVVMRRKGATGRTPTIVEAYGGYGADTVYPAYARNDMAWLDKGGAYAYCGTRGGGERGRDWHEGGRGPNKVRGMEDLAACARALTAAGIAPEQGPMSFGGSMAGTLVAPAALRDPSAFGAMLTAVGVVNAARIGAAENGANQFAEMGDPADPAQYRDLVAMDAYHLIANAERLPPTLMTIGLNDKRVAPWMTAKWMARARAKWPNAPIYMRGDTKSGHGIGSAEDVRRAEAADVFAFAWAMQGGG